MASRGFRCLSLVLSLATLIAVPAAACTGITIKAGDGAIVFARTLEFAEDIQSNVIIVPRGMTFVGTTPNGAPGLKWTTKYGCVGMNAFGQPVLGDGLNEKGLHVGVFYFPGYAQFQEVVPAELDQTLAPQNLPGYLLGTCANTAEAVQAARNVRVGNIIFDGFGFVPPFHYIISDASGSTAVLEYLGGELKVHRNPLGVFSNSPSFDWHMTNLSNYVNLRVTNVSPANLDGDAIKGFGQGTGMLGLPGDFTPPSRFVRAVAFSKSALPVETAREAVLQAFHILNQFDIPKGAARGIEHGHQVADYTLWTVAADMTNLKYYYRTYENSRIRMVDLKALDFSRDQIKTISIQEPEQFEDVTARAR